MFYQIVAPSFMKFLEGIKVNVDGESPKPNTLITSDQNQNRDFLIQLIFGVSLIHNDRFY